METNATAQVWCQYFKSGFILDIYLDPSHYVCSSWLPLRSNILTKNSPLSPTFQGVPIILWTLTKGAKLVFYWIVQLRQAGVTAVLQWEWSQKCTGPELAAKVKDKFVALLNVAFNNPHSSHQISLKLKLSHNVYNLFKKDML